ncbi:MAG: DUF4012 domain-containing protein, partial [Nocardioidaceae bacterium]|nr:DUF4012 domain-containing protein [Nocardioidaceae bacterium]
SANRDLQHVERQARVMRAALVRGDVDGARQALQEFQEAADSADATTHGKTWSVFGAMPLLGDDADGVAVVADVLADLGRDGLPPVAGAAEALTADSFQPQDGAFPLKQITAMQEPARRSEQAFADAQTKLAKVDPSGFLGPVAGQFDSLRNLVDDARNTLDSTYRASRLMPTLLGEKKPRYFLMVLQNNAEIRSTGGLPGALSLLRARDGHLDIVDQADMADIGNATAGLELPLTKQEKGLFGDILGTVAADANLTPDIDRAAELIRARWERATQRQIDGVVFVDPVMVSYLLRGTGPVDVPGSEPVTSANVVRSVEHDIYLATPNRKAQSAYQRAVAKSVFSAFTAGNGDSVEALRGMVSAVAEGRLRLHFFDRAAQREIAGTRIAGMFSQRAGHHPQVGIYLNDAGPTKLQYFLDYQASLFSRSCGGGEQRLAGSIEFTNKATQNLPPSVTGEDYPGVSVEPGEQALVVYVTAPRGSQFVSLSMNGQVVSRPVIVPFDGGPAVAVRVRLAPKETQTMEFEVIADRKQDGDAVLEVTPGAFVGSSNTTVRSACTRR